MSPSTPKALWLERGAMLARWILGALFIWMGLTKALHPEAFLKLVRQYDILHASVLLNLVSATLPWFEVFCGVLFVLGVAVRGTALVSLLMLLPFTAIVLQRALEIAAAQQLPFCAVRFDCGCGAGEVFICNKLAENLTLILLSTWLLFGRGKPLSLRFHLAGRTKAPGQSAAPPPEPRSAAGA